MKRLLSIPLFLALAAFSPLLLAGPDAAKDSDASKRRIGPYEAITYNAKILRDVKFDSDGNVYLQLFPEYKEKELVVKISNEQFGSYRQWWHGGYELVSPANQGKEPYGWTDYVNTAANYIEYWMDGEVFLHLKRVN